MRLLLFGLLILISTSCFAESGCFHSVAEAARRAGVRDEGGFRAEGVRRDVLSGLEWVRVSRCGKPEIPEVLVRGVAAPAAQSSPVRPMHIETEKIAVVAGDAVRLVWEEGAVRGELAGVAVVSGVVGARVHVRLDSFAKATEGRLVAGVVRATGLVELLPGLEATR